MENLDLPKTNALPNVLGLAERFKRVEMIGWGGEAVIHHFPSDIPETIVVPFERSLKAQSQPNLLA